MRLFAWLLAIILAVYAPDANATDAPIVHGTINVVLANAQGIVVLTDSMQTAQANDRQEQLPQPGQKLFQLDNHTLCAVAGFLAGPTSAVPEFLNTTAAIIEAYKRQASYSSRPMGFHEKVGALASVFKFYLSGIADIRGDYKYLDRYRFQMFVVGFDLDGAAMIGSIELSMRPGLRGADSVMEESSETSVKDSFLYLLHGVPTVAEKIMRDPNEFPNDPAIRTYADAKRSEVSDFLTTVQLKALAVALAKHTAEQYKSVGGPNQIAVLQAGKVMSIDQPHFRAPSLPPFEVNLASWNVASGELIALPSAGSVHVYVRNRYADCSEVILDTNFFVSNRFLRCPIVYDGNITRFGKDNEVIDSVLIIGPHATDRDQIEELRRNFAWQAICEGKGGRGIPPKMSCTNRSGDRKDFDWPWPWPEGQE